MERMTIIMTRMKMTGEGEDFHPVVASGRADEAIVQEEDLQA
jgi:hypothetical protein